MRSREISHLSILKLYLWLELKRWSRITAFPSQGKGFLWRLILTIEITIAPILVFAVNPLWIGELSNNNPRILAISALIVLLVGLFIVSFIAAIIPMKDSMVPMNPFQFDFSDLCVISVGAGRPMTWALVGWFRIALTAIWYVILGLGFIIGYVVLYNHSAISLFTVMLTLFLGFHLILLSGSFVYTFTEEIIEKIKPRWREENPTKIVFILNIVIFAIVFGGLFFMKGMTDLGTVSLENVVQNNFYLFPFNVIYLVISSLSYSWNSSMFFLSLFSLILVWMIISLLYFLVIGKVDPVTRLIERQALVEGLASPNVGFFSLPRFLKKIPQMVNRPYIRASRYLCEVLSLLYKDFIFLGRTKGLFMTGVFILLHYTYLLLIVSSTFEFVPFFFVPGVIFCFSLVFTLWKSDSKKNLNTLNISQSSLLVEKWVLLFGIFIVLFSPLALLMTINLNLFEIVLVVISLFHLWLFGNYLLFRSSG